MARTTKKTTKTKASRSKARANGKFSFINELYDRTLQAAEVTRSGEVRIKKSELKKAVEETFVASTRAAARGERVRFPVIGVLGRKDVKARKSGKGVNPFTGEPMTIKARPESKKPRWSFPKAVKETFANKRNWR